MDYWVLGLGFATLWIAGVATIHWIMFKKVLELLEKLPPSERIKIFETRRQRALKQNYKKD